MIRTLQKRFIRIAVLALTGAMVLLAVIVNTVNLISVRGEMTSTLELLTRNDIPSISAAEEMTGAEKTEDLPEQPADSKAQEAQKNQNGPAGESDFSPGRFWEGTRHFRNMVNESAWFSVHFDEEGKIRNKNLNRMGDADEETITAIARQALNSGKNSGWLHDYCFAVRKEGSGYGVVMLDCETRMTAVRTLAMISGIACVCGILLAWLLVRLASRKAVDPVIRNMEQQKRFITDASHELKTPLTVISTNMELLKMEMPDNTWVRSTQKQTAAMRHLVDELVYLSRMEEEHPALTMESLNLGPMLQETAEPFQAMAEFSGKEMRIETEDGLRITGDRGSIQRLMSTLCDNATKYTPEGGKIFVGAHAEGKNAVITVSNTVEKPLTKEQCQQLFNRFYRADSSRNKGKQSGFGIGLAIASAIAEKHGGTIRADMEDDRLRILCTIPRETKKNQG